MAVVRLRCVPLDCPAAPCPAKVSELAAVFEVERAGNGPRVVVPLAEKVDLGAKCVDSVFTVYMTEAYILRMFRQLNYVFVEKDAEFCS